MERVRVAVANLGEQPKTMFLPHCTWDKFGEILANAGGRSFGLFDELTAFFSTMNMYSSVKMQISDTKEYQDFLQLFTGKSKTRETITGNANFRMTQTSFTMFGFTQPQTALPIIEDVQNNAKGFTSRILWFFPEPVYCKMQDTRLTAEENSTVETFQNELVEFLASLYVQGEQTYSIEDGEKIVSVIVDRTMYTLSPEAMKMFEDIHDDWELSICEKFPHDVLIGGLFSRGKAHVLRLAVSIHLLLDFWSIYSNTKANAEMNADENPMIEPTSANNENAERLIPEEEITTVADEEAVIEDEQHVQIGTQPIAVAASIVKTCLTQLCLLSNRGYVVNNQDEESQQQAQSPSTPQGKPPNNFRKLQRAVLSTPGKIVSFSILNKRGIFKKEIGGLTGRDLMTKVAKDLQEVGLGKLETYNSAGNNIKVHYFVKQPVPEIESELTEFLSKIATLGIHLEGYKYAYNSQNVESNDGQDHFAGGRSSYRSGVTLYSNGTNTWFNPKMFTTLCGIEVKYFPFDIQVCHLKFGSLVYDARTMNIEPLKNMTFPAAHFQENGEWDIYELKMQRREQYYQCCPDDPFVEITVTIQMGRESMDYFINLIVPCCLISSMIFLGFILPPESGERIGLSITVLLAMTVFQQLTSEIMPSYDFPILGQYYFAIIMEIGASVVVTTMILNFYHRTNRKMPGWVKKLVIDWIATIVFLTNTSEKRKIVRRKTLRRSRRRPRQRSRIQNDSRERSIKKKQEDIKDQQNQGFNMVTFSDTIYCGPSVSEPVNTDVENLGRQNNYGVNSYSFQASHEALEVPLKNNEEARPYMDDSDTLSEDELAIRHWEWTLVAKILDRFFLVVAIICGIVTVSAIFLRAPKLWLHLEKITSDNPEPLY